MKTRGKNNFALILVFFNQFCRRENRFVFFYSFISSPRKHHIVLRLIFCLHSLVGLGPLILCFCVLSFEFEKGPRFQSRALYVCVWFKKSVCCSARFCQNHRLITFKWQCCDGSLSNFKIILIYSHVWGSVSILATVIFTMWLLFDGFRVF